MTGTGKDTAAVAYVTTAAATFSLTDVNEVLMAAGLALGVVLAIMRIVRGVKYWNNPPTPKE